MPISGIGAVCFGLVFGWLSYRTLPRKTGSAAISDIATITGTVGTGITTFFRDETIFGFYSLGLAVGFFAYLVVNLLLYGKESVNTGLDVLPPPGNPSGM